MTIENNFSFIDIKKFVDNTLDVCMEDGIYSPVYYDYAFRCMCVTYFTDVDLSEMSNEDRMNWIYGEEYFEFLNSCGNKEKSLIDMLDKACKAEADIIIKRNMIDYKETRYPDGLSRIAESIENTSKTIGEAFNEQSLLNIAKKTYEDKQAAQKKARRRPRVPKA